jgi:cytochrome b pre-mRNA-processing protein 3
MKSPVFRRDPRNATIDALYGVIVAQARSPHFYRACAVPDTVNGRLEMLLLHVFLFFQRVRREADPIRLLGQQVFDRFCRDMDDNLREMGVGDLAVPKQMRQIGEAFYGRAKAYDGALAVPGDAALAKALLRNVYSGASGHAADARRLATYTAEAVRHLSRQEVAGLAEGQVSFPDPAPLLASQPAPDVIPQAAP